MTQTSPGSPVSAVFFPWASFGSSQQELMCLKTVSLQFALDNNQRVLDPLCSRQDCFTAQQQASFYRCRERHRLPWEEDPKLQTSVLPWQEKNGSPVVAIVLLRPLIPPTPSAYSSATTLGNIKTRLMDFLLLVDVNHEKKPKIPRPFGLQFCLVPFLTPSSTLHISSGCDH